MFSVLEEAQFAFSVIVKQVLGLSPEDPVTARILEDFLAFMKGLISFPLYIPGTPYAKAVQVIILTCLDYSTLINKNYIFLTLVKLHYDYTVCNSGLFCYLLLLITHTG